MPYFSDCFTETNNKPHCSDAAKLNYVVFFLLEVTAALNRAKISSSIFTHTCRKPSEENKFNILFMTSANLK